jgi:hypothetical protein
MFLGAPNIASHLGDSVSQLLSNITSKAGTAPKAKINLHIIKAETRDKIFTDADRNVY